MGVSFTELMSGRWLLAVAAMVLSYLLGSVNFAIVLSRLTGAGDIRKEGSGNAGMTNMLRARGIGPAALTAVGDVGKSLLAVWFSGWLLSHGETDPQAAAVLTVLGRYGSGVCCMLGHLFPLYFGFRGGKGVLAALGVLLVMDWRVGLGVVVVFAIVFALSHMVSPGSLAASLSAIPFTVLSCRLVYHWGAGLTVLCTAAVTVMVILIFIMHRGNIVRLIHGEERKFSFGRKKG